jgi:splicing factor 3B subunit 4
MNGQYLMNKEVSVQYAYKKDGKGERHGDQAERMLAAQARKHNVQPQGQPIPPQLMTGMPPMTPSPAMSSMPGVNADFGPPRGMPNGNYQSVPPPPQARPTPPPITPLATPPSGLPARPPPSQAGYGGPQSFMPPGFNNPPPGFPPPQGVPGFAPPPSFAPPGQIPGQPPVMPPGFQTGYGRGR